MGEAPKTPAGSRGLRVWHLCLATAFVAVAIWQIQAQRRTEPALVALAAGGFVLYAGLALLGWRLAPRTGLKGVPLLAAYLAAMAALFLVACVMYLAIENRYLGV